MQTVIVTGGAGFLGSHITLRHLRKGDCVLVLDDFSTSLGRDSNHVKAIEEFDHSLVLDCDIVNKEDIEACISDWRASNFREPNLIYNFACPASPPRYQDDPVKTMMTSVVGTKNMLDIAGKYHATLLHASTSEVYGDPSISPQKEDYRGNVNSYGPRACYDEGKRAAEALCFDYKNKYDVDARLVRIFNTYGPHMDPDDGRVVSNFIMQALRGEPLTIYGDGSQTRSFCYVSDLVNVIIRYACCGSNLNQPINIGNPKEFTVLELAKLVNEKVGNTAGIITKPFPVDDPLQRKPDIKIVNSFLDWRPEVSLVDGLEESIRYFRKFL